MEFVLMKNHIDKKTFLLEFFGNFGRDLGNPKQFYTDNPQDIFPFMEECAKNKEPAFYSVQPRLAHDEVFGIEKLFFEFDDSHENEEVTAEEIKERKVELIEEVKRFVQTIINDWGFQPLIIKTRRGYHVYIYFDMVYRISKKIHFWKVVYRILQEQFIDSYEAKFKSLLKYNDTSTLGDIKRLGRIPLSIHQKSGEECIIVKPNLKPDKLHSINYFRVYGLRRKHLKTAISLASKRQEQKEKEMALRKEDHNEKWEIQHGFIGEIRPCFKVRMEAGEMCHDQRLSLRFEAYWAGYNTPEKMIELFHCFKDWDGDKPNGTCEYQVNYFFAHPEMLQFRPYRCSTIQKFGWCIYEKCPIFQRRKTKNAENKS